VRLLHVLYRTHPGGNRKPRPHWFSRALALKSLQRSVALLEGPTRWTFVADGGMSEAVAGLVRPGDDVVVVRGGAASSSLRRTVDVAVRAGAEDPAGTLYWFAEDDYLYRPEAVTQLTAAAQLLGPDAYLTLYTCDITSWCARHPSQPLVAVTDVADVDVGGIAWHRIGSTTSSMAVTREALLADAGLLKLGTRAGAPFDLTTWSALQGISPYPWRYLLRDLDGYPTPRGVAKVVAKPPMRALLNVVAALRPAPARRSLWAPVADLAMHLEVDVMPPGDDWARHAAALHGPGPTVGA